MKKSIIKKSVGIILSFILVLSTFAISFQAYAIDDTKENIVIADVVRRYRSAQTILNQVNQMRAEENISAVKMDKTLMEAAMKRAAELSISYNKYALDGTGDYGAGANGIVYGYSSLGCNSVLGTALDDSEKAILKVKDYKSVGVGAVSVCGTNLVCVLLSDKTADEVDSSVYNQENVYTDQETVCMKSNLKNLSLIYPDGYQIYCGSQCEVYFKVKNTSTNKPESEFYALIPSECLRISSSDTSVLSVSDGYIKAVKPGTSSITAYLKDDLTVNATSLIKVISLKFSNCKISSIPDMKYTGNPVQPEVVITDDSGKQLIKGQDYTLSYTNNISVGTASVNISGIGRYAGEKSTAYFNIIPNEDIEYRVSVDVSPSESGADETIKVTAKNNLEDTTTRYTFDYSAYGSNKWTTAQSASYDNKCSLRISVPGKYIIRVTAENGSGMSASSQSVITINSALALNVTLNAQKIVLGNYIEITAQASGSVSPYTYTYKIKNDEDGNWIDIKTNTTDTSASY
ncbi:MAG: CAP domain-containing protein, partial [Acutalibacteraceae bacterium]